MITKLLLLAVATISNPSEPQIVTVLEHAKCVITADNVENAPTFWNVVGEIEYARVPPDSLGIWAPPGEYTLFSNEYDAVTETIVSTRFLLNIVPRGVPDNPDKPKPPPKPDVAEDKFDNVGQYARKKIIELGIPVGALSDIYRTAGAALQSGDLQNMMTMAQARAYILAEIEKTGINVVPLRIALAPFYDRFITSSSNKFEVGEFYSALAKGL